MGSAAAPWMFDWVEYIVFVVMLCVSALIGIYFGCIKGGQDTVTGYLLGGKQMSLIPISVSLVTTYISGITLLGVPSEIYTYGSQYLTSNLANYLVGFITAFFILPVFYKLQLISLYEYMELRFGHGVRIIVSVLFTISLISYIPVVIYGPALALNQVTGIDVQWVSIVVSLVCIFYTTLGGLEAVVWTDTIQGLMMVMSIATVLIVGTIRVGGVGHVITSAMEGGRVEFFNMDPDPTVRLTFWSSFIGVTFFWSAHFAFSPASMQRYISLPTYRDAQKSVIFLCLGVSFFITMSGLVGFVMYTHFKDCDPLLSGLITRPDQILPLFVVKVCGDIKGLSGLFLSGVVCAALSSMSAGLNTVAGTFYEDFLEPVFNEKLSEKKASFVMKVLVVLFGFISVCLVSVIEKLGAILEISAAFGGMTAGTTLGLFLLGLLFPWANNKGAMVGGLTSLCCMAWLTVGQYIHKTSSDFAYPSKPMSVQGCQYNFTLVTPKSSIEEVVEIPFFYRLSVFYYSMLGSLIVVVVGLVVSFLTGFNRLSDVNPDLLSPLVHPLLPRKAKGDVKEVKFKTCDVTNGKHRACDVTNKTSYESVPLSEKTDVISRFD
uniref:Sodium-coupled monocarboxylate transporter 2 n=2 Tax=Lygus hesperus TaxID=30085 RepID=A0A146KR03_LYGHE